MYGVDQYLIAGTIAALFWAVATVYLQKKWHIYTVFMGKKHALTAHIIVMSFVLLQLLTLTVWDIISHWLFTMALWPLGAIVFAASSMLFFTALSESGPGVLVGAAVFGRKHPRTGKTWKQYKQPVALGIGGMYVGLGLLTGHIVYLIVGVGLGLGMWGVSVMTKKLLA